MTFQNVYFLFGIPICFTLIVATLFIPRCYLSKARIILPFIRLLSFTSICVAFASPVITSDKPSDSLTALIDISDSVPEERGEEFLTTAKILARQLGIPLTVVPFGKKPAPSPLPAPSTFRELKTSWQQLDTGGTNIELVLQRSSTLGAQSVILATDGYENDGIAQDGIINGISARIFPLLSSSSRTSEEENRRIEISQLTAPLTVQSQKSVDIRVSIHNPNVSAQDATLTVIHGKNELISRPVRLFPEKEDVILVQSDPSQEGLNEITAELRWQDAQGSHTSVKTIWLSGEKRDKVLLLNGTPDDGRLLPTILRNQTYTLQSWTAGEREPQFESLSEYQTVILNNIPRNQLPRRVVESITSYVRQGGRLLMIGGNRSFGLGGYIDSEIEEILPVRLVPPTTEKKRLNVAVQLVIDKSRSMASDNRLDYAKEAASQVVRNLKDDDYIGVIGFDETPFVAQPISPVGQVRDLVVDRVNRLFPNRKTELFPAIDEARRGLLRVDAGRKHMIVLTDGKIPDAGEYYLQLVRQLKPLGITLSTILVGGENDDGFLGTIANIGGGKFYSESDPRNLPSIFLSDVRVATGERTMKESSLLSVRPGPDHVSLTQLREFPVLRGYVETLRRQDAQTQLIALSEDKGSPLLATMKVGKGISTAFTSDANGRWSSEWMRWSGIAEFWSDLVDAGRQNSGESQKRFAFDVRSWVERGEVVVDVSVFDDTEGKPLSGAITLPSGVDRNTAFTQSSPGHYIARVPQGSAGKYLAKLKIGEVALPDVAWSLEGELFGEQKRNNQNIQLLSDLAFKSGGKLSPSKDDLIKFIRNTIEAKSLALPFLILALLFFGVELVTREILRRRG
jgi:uncharacterized membrane protein